MEVLEARLRRPASRRGLVVRSELVARLVRAGDVRVVLLRAGAGYGKTTLLTQWAERDSRPFAWVTLDETHDDPEALTGDVGRAVEAVLSPPGGRRPFVLVLDDLHRVRSPRSLALLAALVERLPPGCQLALASRREPALPLARWSVQGDL